MIKKQKPFEPCIAKLDDLTVHIGAPDNIDMIYLRLNAFDQRKVAEFMLSRIEKIEPEGAKFEDGELITPESLSIYLPFPQLEALIVQFCQHLTAQIRKMEQKKTDNVTLATSTSELSTGSEPA